MSGHFVIQGHQNWARKVDIKIVVKKELLQNPNYFNLLVQRAQQNRNMVQLC